MSDQFTQPNPYANINLNVNGASPVNLKPLGSLDDGSITGPQALQNLEKSFGISQPQTMGTGGSSAGGSNAFGFQDPLARKFDPANPLGLNKKQLEAYNAQQHDAFLKSIGDSVTAKFQANPDFTSPNTSVQRKTEIIDNYLNNTFAEYVNTQFADNPELGQQVKDYVGQSLADAKLRLSEGVDADNAFNSTWQAGKVGFANADAMRQAVMKNLQDATDQQRIQELQNAYDNQANNAQTYSSALSQEMQNDLKNIRDTRALIDQKRQQLAAQQAELNDPNSGINRGPALNRAAYESITANLADDISSLEEQLSGYQNAYAEHEQQYNAPNQFQSDVDNAYKQLEDYKDSAVKAAAKRLNNLLAAMSDAEIAKQTAMKNSPLYRELQLRQQELRDMYGDDYLIGLQGNANKIAYLMSLMAEQTPYLLTSLGAGAVSGGAGLAVAGALMTMGDAATSTVDTLLAQDQSTMDKLPEYRDLIDRGYNDKEARVIMGLAAARDKQGAAIVTGAILNLVGPEAMVTKSGLWGKLFGKKGALNTSGVATNRFARVPVSGATGAADEGLEESVTQLIANWGAQSAGAKVDLTEDVLSAGAMGALMGGPMGAAGGLSAFNNPGVAPMSMLTVTDQDGNTQQEVVQQKDQRSALASMAERFGVDADAIQAQDLSDAAAYAVQNARKKNFVELTATDKGGETHNITVEQNKVKNAINTLAEDAGVKPEDITQRKLSDTEKNVYIANLVAQKEAVENARQAATQNSGQTESPANTNARIIQGSQFYNTQAQQQQQQQRTELATNLNDAFNSIRAQQAAYTSETLPEADVMRLVPLLMTLERTDARGTEAVNDVLTGLLGTSSQQVNLTWDGLKKRYTDITAGKVNGNTSGNQGAAQANSAPAAPTVGTANAVPSANPQSNIGNSTAAQGTGTGGTTRSDTGPAAAPVQPNQPQTATSEGTNSGRDSQQPAGTGTQPDTGTGSSAGQTEQRTGTDAGTEANGSTEQAGADVASPTPEQTVAPVPSGAELARQTLITDFGAELTEQAQKQLEDYYNRIYEDLSKPVKNLKDPLSDDEKALCATIAVRQAITLAQVQGISIDSACADLYDSFRYQPDYTSSNGSTRVRIKQPYALGNISSIMVDINTAPNKRKFSTVVHEFTHAFLYRTLQHRADIERAAKKGNPAAIEYIQNLSDLAAELNVKGNPWNINNWDLVAEETITTVVQMKLFKKDLPARTGLTKAIDKISDRIARGLAGFLKYLREFSLDMQDMFGILFNENSKLVISPAVMNFDDVRRFLGYVVPPLRAFHNNIPPALNTFINRMVTGYLGTDSPLNNTQATAEGLSDSMFDASQMIVLTDVAATAYIARNIEAGMTPKDAMENANKTVAEVLDLMSMTPEQRSAYVAQRNAREKQDKLANDPTLTMASTPDESVVAAVGSKDTSYSDVLNMQNGFTDPANTVLENTPMPLDTDTELVDHNVPNYDAVPSQMQEEEEKASLAQQIIDVTNNDTDPNVEPVENREWFDDFINNNNAMLDEFGEPLPVYRVGNRISTVPTGAELEVQVYAQRGKVYDQSEPIEDKALAGRITRLYNRLLDAFNNGNQNELNLTEQESQDMRDAGIGSFEFLAGDEATYIIADVAQSSDMYEGSTVFSANESVGTSTINANATEDSLLNEATMRVSETETRYQRALLKQRENLDTIRAYYNSLAYNAVQQSGWWQWVARTARLTGDDGAHFHEWVTLNLSPTLGEADTDPFYQQVINARQEIHGAWAYIHDQILAPLDSFIFTAARDIGKDPVAVARAIGQARTDLHILEAQDRQIYELHQAQVDAMMLFSADAVDAYNKQYGTAFNKYDVNGARDAAITWAKLRVDTWNDLQNNADRKPKPDDPVKLIGGRRAADVRTELSELSNTYGDALIREGVNRLGIAYKDLVSHLIEKGVFSEEDISNFGQWLYYTPLTVRADLEHGAANDVVSVFSPKMNYHREGSITPAQDGYTALMNMANRSANAIGTVKLGLAAQHAYQHLAEQYDKKDPNVVMAMQRAGNPESSQGGFIRYYNGMAMAPLAMAKAVNVDPALTVRIIVPAKTDAQGNVTTPERTVPYAIWFNEDAMSGRAWENNLEVETTMPAHDQVQKALTNQFRFDPKAKSNILVRGVRKSTSVMGSLYTTYSPMFPVINMQRDIIERAAYMAARNYRVTRPDGSMGEVSGAVISAKFAALCLNPVKTIQTMQAAWTGKNNAKGDMGKYLEEFKQSGIMTTASVRAMLDTEGNRAYAFLTENVGELKNLSSVAGKGLNVLKGVNNTAHKWSEMLYTVAPFAQFMAMRQMGISAEEASFYVTELMNLRMNSKLGKNVLSVLFPFTASIMQTTLQLAKFYGLSATTFGHSKSKAQLKKAAFTWATTAGMVYLGTALIPMLASALGGGDEEKGYRLLDSMGLSAFNFIPLPIGVGEYIKQPIGFGPTMFGWQLAIALDRYMRGADSGTSLTFGVLASIWRNTTPLGGPEFDIHNASDFGQFLGMTICPTILQPLAESYVFKRDHFGGQIDKAAQWRKDTDRASDSYDPRTPPLFRVMAQSLYDVTGWDMAPEQLMHTAAGYLAGPMRGIMAIIQNDPLVQDPMHTNTRRQLGPLLTAMGATSYYAHEGNAVQRDFYNAKAFYDAAIKRAGLGDAIKGKGPNDQKKSDHIKNVMLQAGFSLEAATDCAKLYDAEYALNKYGSQYRKDMRKAMLHNADDNTLRMISETYFRQRNNYLNSQVPMLHLYNSKTEHMEMVKFSREQANSIRMGVDRTTLFDILESK